MANYCSSSFTIHGENEKAILDYYFKMREAMAAVAEGEERVPWCDNVRKLLEELKCKPELVDKIDNRTSITDMSLNKEGMRSSIIINTESPWSVCEEFIIATIDAALEDKTEGVQECFIAEEGGMDYYVCSDCEGKYYPERYRVEVCCGDYEDTTYYTADEEDEMIDFIKEVSGYELASGEDLDRGNVLEKIQKGFEAKYGIEATAGDYYLIISRYDIVDSLYHGEDRMPTMDELIAVMF